MKGAVLQLVVLLLVSVAAFGSDDPTAVEEAAYAFSRAKLLADGGSLHEAHRWFQRAVELAGEDAYLRLEYANFLLRLGALPLAARQLDEARRLAPEEPEVLREFGRVYLVLGEDDEAALGQAREALEALRRIDPADVASMLSLGQVYLGLGEAELAVEVFRELLRHRPQTRAAYALLVDALKKKGDSEGAESVLGELVGRERASVRDHLALAELQSERGDHEAAAATLESVPESERDAELDHRLAYELFRAGRLAEADALLVTLARRQPVGAATHLRAFVLAAQGYFVEAAEVLEPQLDPASLGAGEASMFAGILERAARLDEAVVLLHAVAAELEAAGEREAADGLRLRAAAVWADAGLWSRVEPLGEALVAEGEDGVLEPAWRLLAEALVRQERGGEALARLEAESRRPEAEVAALAARVETLLLLERPAEAEAAMARLVGAAGGEGAVRAAEILQRHEDFEGSIAFLEVALADHGEEARTLFRLGAAYERTGDFGEAEAAFGRLLDIEPDFAPALNYLGYMWAERGEKLDAALGLIRRAVALEPDNGAYVDSLGWVHYQRGDLEAAESLLERAARLRPDDAVILEHLGDVYLRRGRPEAAASAYRQALGIGDDNAAEVERKLRALEVD